MSVGDIYIYGTIRNEQSEELNSIWGEVSLTSVKNAVSKLPSDTTDLIVHIHSNGGDVFEGFAIYDYLQSLGKNITTKIEGMCASIATIVAFAGSKRLMTKNSTFMIHNPVMGFAMGDADDLEAQAELLREIEDKIVAFYAEKTGQSKKVIDGWMKDEKFMTAEEALDLGFITEIAEELKVAAVFSISKHKQSKTIEMSAETKNLLTSIKDTLDKVQKLFGKEVPQIDNNLTLNTQDGGKIEVVTAQEIPNPKDKVNIDGKPAPDGEYLLMDGTKIVVSAGEIATVTDPEGNKDNETVPEKDEQESVLEALKKENQDLRSEIEELKTIQLEMNKTVSLIAENIESAYDPKAKKNAFNTKKEDITNETPAQRALRMKKEAEQK